MSNSDTACRLAAQYLAAELSDSEGVRHIELLAIEDHDVLELTTSHVCPTGAQPQLRSGILPDEVSSLGLYHHDYAIASLSDEIRVMVDEPVDAELTLTPLDNSMPP